MADENDANDGQDWLRIVAWFAVALVAMWALGRCGPYLMPNVP